MKKTKLILSFYVGVIALGVSTIAMSVAWYATNARLNIDSIIISVDTDRDLQISTHKNDGYVESIEYNKHQFTDVFVPITSAYSSEWVTISDKPVFYDESKAKTVENVNTVTVIDHGYFSQKFYLRADDDVYVSIDPTKTSVTADNFNQNYSGVEEIFNKRYPDVTDNDEKQELMTGIANDLNKVTDSLRFSIYIPSYNEAPYEIIDPKKNDVTYYSGLLDNDIDKCFDYYQKEEDGLYYETFYGEYTGELAYYDDVLDTDSEFMDINEKPYTETDANAFVAKHKADVKRINLTDSVQKKGLKRAIEPSHSLADFDVAYKPYHFPVYRDEPTEIILSVYVEGWDVDSVNYTMGAQFTSNLSFMIEREI